MTVDWEPGKAPGVLHDVSQARARREVDPKSYYGRVRGYLASYSGLNPDFPVDYETWKAAERYVIDRMMTSEERGGEELRQMRALHELYETSRRVADVAYLVQQINDLIQMTTNTIELLRARGG